MRDKCEGRRREGVRVVGSKGKWGAWEKGKVADEGVGIILYTITLPLA